MVDLLYDVSGGTDTSCMVLSQGHLDGISQIDFQICILNFLSLNAEVVKGLLLSRMIEHGH